MFNFSEKVLQYLKKLKEKGEVVPTSTVEEKSYEEEKNYDSEKDALKSELIKLNLELKGQGGKVSLEEMTYEPLTKEEIEEKAKKSVEEKYSLKKDALDKELDNSLNLAKESGEAIVASSKAKKGEIEKLYESLEEKLGTNALKRGISRSTIVSEQIRNLSTEKIKDLLQVDDSVATELKKNDDKIEKLKSDYISAVNNLNVEKAIEINDNIESITKAQNDKIEEVLKYNNNVKKEEATINNKVEPVTEIQKSRINNEIIKQAINYYSKIPKDKRMDEFYADKDILELLGDQSYIIAGYLKAME